MRDILIDGVPVLDLLEITGSTSAVASLSRCDQSSVSRLYRHTSDQLGLDFRKSKGQYRAHANQAVLRALRHTAQLLRFAQGCQRLQWLGCPATPHLGWSPGPLPRRWRGEGRTLDLLRERVVDLAVIDGHQGFPAGWHDRRQPLVCGDWVVLGLTPERDPLGGDAVVLRHDTVVLRHDALEHAAVQELIARLRHGVGRSDPQPFANVGATDPRHDRPPAAGHPDRRDAGPGARRPQPQPQLAAGAA